MYQGDCNLILPRILFSKSRNRYFRRCVVLGDNPPLHLILTPPKTPPSHRASLIQPQVHSTPLLVNYPCSIPTAKDWQYEAASPNWLGTASAPVDCVVLIRHQRFSSVGSIPIGHVWPASCGCSLKLSWNLAALASMHSATSGHVAPNAVAKDCARCRHAPR